MRAEDFQGQPRFHGRILLPQRAVFDPANATLFVADIHFGKAAAFRALGAPVPAGTTADNLARLSALLASTGAGRLVVLGDLLHARAGTSAALLERLRGWRAQFREAELVLVAGNHDRHAEEAAAALDMACVAEPFETGGIACRHHPASAADARAEGAPILAGHLHPAARLVGPGRDRLRLPCFFRQGRQLILPSFGAFTGGWEVNGAPGDEVFVICDDRIVIRKPSKI